MRDKVSSWAADARELGGKKARHLGNRARGVMAEARSMAAGRG